MLSVVSQRQQQTKEHRMDSIADVAQRWQQVLGPWAAELERSSGFVQRRSKLDGPHFAQTLVLGWLAHPRAPLSALAQLAACRGVALSVQGLAQRFSQAAVEFLRQLLERAVTQMTVAAEPVAIALLQRFTAVWIADSTVISLPAALADQWRGCGGGHLPGQGSAALKLQVRLEALTGQLGGPLLQDGRTHDGATPWQQEPLAPGSLRLVDLGYSCLERLAAWSAAGTYWLLRLEVQTAVFGPRGTRLRVPRWLRRQTGTQAGASIAVPVTLGVRARVPARLLAVRVTRAEATRRRAAIRKAAKRQGQPLSQERLDRAGWTIYITNVPEALLTLEEALVLARLRWQIELLFKLWKDHGAVDEWRSAQPDRILCEVYAKLLGQVLQHWLLLVTAWAYPDRSLRQAVHTIQTQIGYVAAVLDVPDRLAEAFALIGRCLAVGCRLTTRRRAPSTFQRLRALADE
jgi:hypothetical protein